MNRQAMTRLARALGRASFGCAAVLAAALAVAQSSGEMITPNFKNVDIGQVAEAVSMVTHKNFILDPRVQARVTMLSSTPVSPSAFYQIFLAILQVHGFIAVPAGNNVMKIVPDAEERYMPGKTLPSRVSPTSDAIVTQVVKVQHVSAAQLVPVLRPLVPNQGQLAAYPPSNILIISDRATNVSRLVQIIHRIDQSDTSNVDVIPLQNASAAEVARVVSSLYQGATQSRMGGAPLKLVADARSNSILLSGDEEDRLRVKALIAHLDTPAAYGGGTQVRYLRYEDAKTLAPKLKQQIQGMEKAAAAAKGGPNAGGGSTEPEAQIWADEQNNALVITAPPKTMHQIDAIIDRLDIRRAQVLVQAIIVDVDFDKSTELGVNWAIYSQGNTIPGATFLTPVGGASLVDLANTILTPSNLPNTGLVNGTTIALGRVAKTGISFAAMLRALESNDDSDIIATPSMVTMDHQEATIQVAQQVPFVTGEYAGASTAVNGIVTPFQTIQNETVGTILKITPDINSRNTLILKIHIESSSLLPESSAGGSAVTSINPITSKRTVDTEVLVRNGGILVIGGLISNEYSRTKNGVPLLSHIPLLGQLFEDREGSLQKKNLMIFIRPQILDSAAEAAEATDAEYQFMRKQQQTIGQKELLPLVPGAKSSVLPPPPKGAKPPSFQGCCDIAPIPSPPAPGSTPSARATPRQQGHQGPGEHQAPGEQEAPREHQPPGEHEAPGQHAAPHGAAPASGAPQDDSSPPSGSPP